MNVLYLRGLKSIKKVSQISIKNYLIIIYSMIHTNRQMQFRVKNIYIFKKSNSYIKKKPRWIQTFDQRFRYFNHSAIQTYRLIQTI